jgi:membrane associated rhomboid family serine protease
MVRRLIDDFREYPATMVLCSLWVIVLALMVANQTAQGNAPTLDKLVIGVRGGHPFGELTINGLFQGEIWLPLTATFVHYGLLHLGMNLYMMYQLGAVVETWYGPWQFLAVYVAIGFGGNLLSALVRHALGSDPTAASGGGSTVVLGLVALAAVVGWRSRTRIGAYLRSQMVGLLIATAVLGQMVPIIDNWGHAGGALMGAAIGFAHRILIRTAHRPVAKWLGSLAVILLIAAGAALIREDRNEARALVLAQTRLQAGEQSVQSLQQVRAFFRLAAKRSLFERLPIIHELYRRARSEILYQDSVARPSFVRPLSLLDSSDEEFRTELKRQLNLLDTHRDLLGTGPTAADFQRIRWLLARVLKWPPSDRTIREFEAHFDVLFRQAMQNQETARAELESLRHHIPLGWGLSPRARLPARRPAGAGDGPSAAAAPR